MFCLILFSRMRLWFEMLFMVEVVLFIFIIKVDFLEEMLFEVLMWVKILLMRLIEVFLVGIKLFICVIRLIRAVCWSKVDLFVIFGLVIIIICWVFVLR